MMENTGANNSYNATLDKVIERLFDDLDKTEADWELARNMLPKLMKEKNLSMEQLDDLCFEDSTMVFDYIYGFDI